MEFIEFYKDISLPYPKGMKGISYPSSKRWIEAYKICLEEIVEMDGNYVHAIVPNIGKVLNKRLTFISDGNQVSNRFIGEMCDHGYLRVHKDYKFRSVEQERVITLTAKLSKLTTGNIDSTIMPRDASLSRRMLAPEIRRGVDTKSNKEIVRIVSNHTAKLRFNINNFIYSLVHKDGSNLLDDLTILKDDSALIIKEKKQKDRIRTRAFHSCDTLGQSTFWFPQFFDSRGRIYTATTAGISPQGADLERALIEPSFKESLTSGGFDALIETLNGYSDKEWSIQKMTYHGNNPEKTQEEWLEADKPFSYIANAKYLARYMEDKGVKLPSFIPLDGRASALQHWSALLGSNAVTSYIGMEEIEPESDMYEYYRDLVHPNIEDDTKWVMEGSIGRKAAKKPVMTFAYGGRLSSTEEYIQKEFKGKASESKLSDVSKVLYNGLSELLVDIIHGFKWITEVASIISKGKDQVTWITPDGFIASQFKIKPEDAQVRSILANGYNFDTEFKNFDITTANPRGHSSALSPNLIHSFDACHLRMVARKMESLNLPVIFIHDSFSTHVNYREELYSAIKETFVEMYSSDWLSKLKDYWEYNYLVKLPDPPKMGKYDVTKVLKLDLFFT